MALTNVPVPKTRPQDRVPVNRVWALSGELEKGATGEGNAPHPARTCHSPASHTGERECREMLALLGLQAVDQMKL